VKLVMKFIECSELLWVLWSLYVHFVR
jgi:hypothetical protein